MKKQSVIEKIVNILLDVFITIFGIVLLCTIYIAIQTKVMHKGYADFFGYSIFEVQTGSMGETVEVNDWIVVKITKDVKLQDIITYELDGNFITHRVVEVYGTTYVTKGDANTSKDQSVDKEHVVGKVVKVLKGVGLIKKTVLNPAVLIVIIITLFIVSFLFKKKNNTLSQTKLYKLIGRSKEDDEVDIDEKEFMADYGKVGTGEKVNAISESKKDSKIEIEESEEVEEETDDVEEEEEEIQIVKRKPAVEQFEEEDFDESEFEEPEEELSVVKKKKKQPTFDETEVIPMPTEEELKKIKEEKVKEKDAQITIDVDKDVQIDEDDEVIAAPIANPVSDKTEVLTDLINTIKQDLKDDEESLEKTILYRTIEVDEEEIKNTNLEIAALELEAQKNAEQVEVEEEMTEEEPEIDMSLLKKRAKKYKNCIEKVVSIKESEIEEYIGIFNNHDRLKANELDIKESFKKTYINARFYNLIDNKYSTQRVTVAKVESALKANAKELLAKYKGSDKEYPSKVTKFTNIFMVINYLDKGKLSIDNLNARKEYYTKQINKNFTLENVRMDIILNNINRIQIRYDKTLNFLLDKLGTSMFILRMNSLIRRDVYGVNLEQNLNFSKIYSDFIINKTFNAGTIGEDKALIMFQLLLVQITRDLLSFNFGRKYIVSLPESLYKKEKKLDKLLGIIDNEYVKDNIIIVRPFKHFVENKKLLVRERKAGYKFAISITDDRLANKEFLELAEYIFVDKKHPDLARIKKFVPGDLSNRIVYEDITKHVNEVEVE